MEKELKKLGIPKEEFKLSKLANEIYLDPCDPVENVNTILPGYCSQLTSHLVQIKSRYLPTGHYLRPHDMEFCLGSTDFDEEEIFEWFKRFRNDCPNGKLTRAQLR